MMNVIDQAGMTKLIKNLENERAHLQVGLTHLRQALKTEVEVAIDEGDPELLEHDVAWSLIEMEEGKLNAIDRALQQVRQGKYGICERCGKLIDPSRLEVLPEATLCITCQRASEGYRSG